jgi:hypothetical protein
VRDINLFSPVGFDLACLKNRSLRGSRMTFMTLIRLKRNGSVKHLPKILLAAVLPLAGCCGSVSGRIPLTTALLTVDKDVRDAAIHQSAYLISAEPGKRQAAADQMLSFQCYFGTDDPQVPVLGGAWNIALQGSFQATQKATLGNIGPAPTGALEFDVAEGQTQTLTVPIVYTPISRVPLVYFQQTMSYYNGLSDSAKKPLVTRLVAEVAAMQAVTAEVIARYPGNYNRCPEGSPRPLIATKPGEYSNPLPEEAQPIGSEPFASTPPGPNNSPLPEPGLSTPVGPPTGGVSPLF